VHQTILVAMYGAVVATAVAIWNIYRSITDRGRLRVTVTRVEAFAPGVDEDKLCYEVTNVGRQPIWLTQIGGVYRTRGDDFMIPLNQLPKKLEPGETFNAASPSDAENLDAERVLFFGAWDSFGKIHKLPRRQLKALLKDLTGGKP
jgi:hypothetical protein